MSIQQARITKGNIIARQTAKTPLRFRPVIITMRDDTFKVMEYGQVKAQGLTDFIAR